MQGNGMMKKKSGESDQSEKCSCLQRCVMQCMYSAERFVQRH